jgi:hypothetical protein
VQLGHERSLAAHVFPVPHALLKDAIPLQFGFELVVGNDGLVPPFGYGGQIIQIFEKLLVICNWKHNGLRPGLVGQILQVVTRVSKIPSPRWRRQLRPNAKAQLRKSRAAGWPSAAAPCLCGITKCPALNVCVRPGGDIEACICENDLMTSFAYRLTNQVRATGRHTTPYSDSFFPGTWTGTFVVE